MDRKNFLIFIGILVIMMVLVQLSLSGKVISRVKGRPTVAPPFIIDKDYSISLNEDGIMINLSDSLREQYEGTYLAVYAYDSNGVYYTKLKRVVDGKIIISREEPSEFRVKFRGNLAEDIDIPENKTPFYQFLKDAISSNRNYGLGRCLLGRQGEKICPVKAITLIRDDSPDGRGRIIPKINLRNNGVEGPNVCIEDGWCPAVCPTKLIHLEE